MAVTMAVVSAFGGVLTATPRPALAADPVLGGQLFSTGGEIEITVLPASAGLTSELWLFEPTDIFIATNRQVGTVVEIGPFEKGAELIFGIRAGGNEFHMGPGDRNPDGIPHATVQFLDETTAIVGFEDLFGGGDRDYNDNVFRFSGGIAPEPPPPDPDPEPEPEPGTPPIAAAGENQAVDEGSVVQLDGTASTDPGGGGLIPSTVSGNLPGGTSLEGALDALSPVVAGTQTLTGSAAVGEGTAVPNTALLYVLDISGSTLSGGGCGGNQNGDGSTNSRLDCEIAAARALNQQAIASGTVAEVGVVGFASGNVAGDLSPAPGVQTLTGPGTDADGLGGPDVEEALVSLFTQSSGGAVGFNRFTRLTTSNTSTNFSTGITGACNLLAASAQPNRLVVFLSDGQNNSGQNVNLVLPCSPAATFHTFAAGPGVTCASNPSQGGLQTIANATGGTCTNVANLSTLPDILDDLVGSRLLQILLSIDGGAPVDISSTATPALPLDGPASVEIDYDLPDLGAGVHELCLTVVGSDAGGEDSVTTCSETASGGQLAYRWELIDGDGPPILLSSTTAAKPTFLAPDDGTYTFELTVTNGFGLSDTDRVVVTVANLAPELAIESTEATARGVTLVNATFTDEGWLDSHVATIDWGDGSPVETVPVSAQGAGWGGFFGSHIYPDAGSFAVTATVTDDDGGTSTAATLQLTVGEPVAVWANAQTTSRTLDWSGAEGRIDGRVHTNGQLRVIGETKTVDGPTTYMGSISADTDRHVFTPLPAKTGFADFPFRFELADYRPGGPVATQVGAAYHDMSAQCVSGVWHAINTVLAAGVYYANCNVQINGSAVGGRITLAAEGSITVSGSRPAFEPYFDGLLFLAGSSGDKAIDIAASSSKFLGYLFAGTGEIEVSGSNDRFFCGILGDRIDFTGGGIVVRGASCGRPAATAAGPLLVPELGLALTGGPTDVAPGAEIDYELRLTNDGALLVVPGILGLENVDTTTATTRSYSFVLEYFSIADNAWLPLASAAGATPGYTPQETLPTVGGIALTARPNPFAGVTYPATGDPLLGAAIAPNGFATWGYQALVELTAAQVELLMDPTQVGGLRNQIAFELEPASAQVRRLFRFGNDFVADVRALTGDINDVEITYIEPTGDPSFIDSAEVAGLAVLGPGDSVDIPESYDVAVIPPPADGESDAAYLARLLAADGAALFATAFARATGGVGLLIAPQVHVGSTEHVPVVEVDKTGPAQAIAGATLDYDITVRNRGSVDALDVDLIDELEGSPLTIGSVPATLTPGQIAATEASHTVPANDDGGTIVNRAEATWADAAGNLYGPLGDEQATAVLTPPDLAASLADSLAVDADANGVVSPGDTLAYEAIIRNDGDSPLTGVALSLSPDGKAPLLVGSVTTTIGSVTDGNDAGDTAVAVDVGTLNGHALVSIHFRARVTAPYTFDSTLVSVQGTVASTELDDVPTDDPALAGPVDPTTTRVVVPAPLLNAKLTDALLIDRDGNGQPSANDTIRYTAAIENQGSAPATVVTFTATPDGNTTLVANAVTTSAGTIISGQDPADGFVRVTLGSLAPVTTLTVTFDVRIADPLPSGVSSISTQGLVAAAEFVDPTLTDDPATAAEGDPTVTLLNTDGGPPGNGLPAPTIGAVTPAEGTSITAPTAIGATLTPPAGETVAGWTVSYRLDGDPNLTEIGSGTGTAVSATIDPTTMANGAYLVEIEATASGGGISIAQVQVIVEGELKLGRFQVTYEDMNVDVGGIPLRVLRTYDSFDKARGDFGIGWNVEIANFKVSTNGPLGRGGWTMFQCGGGLIFVPLCFASSRPHFVTVTWPDGRVETFDLTPAKGSTFLSGLTQAEFTGRSGTTSELEAVDNGLYFTGDGNLHGGFFGSGGVYDPTRFRLTDKFGTEYLLDRTTGLVSATDVNGNTVTVSSSGITSSLGPSITFDRDALGRIETMTGPDDKTMTYGYDAPGDLVAVTDQTARTARFEYGPNHYLQVTKDPLNRPLRTLHYEDGRLVGIEDAEGNLMEVDSDPTTRREIVTDAAARLTTVSTFDVEGNLVRLDETADGKTLTTRYTYDDNGNLETRIDPLNHTWTATWDDRGNLLTYRDPTGKVVTLTYENGRVKTWKDPGGKTTTYGYDTSGNLVLIRDPLGKEETFTYDGNGNVLTRTDETDRTWTSTWFGAGQLKTLTDPLDKTWSFTYDDAGRILTSKDPLDHTTTWTYDDAGRTLTWTDPNNDTTTWTYDALGNLETEVDPEGHTLRFHQNANGQVDKRIDQRLKETLYAYDPNHRLTTATDPEGGVVTYGYDGFGRLHTVRDEIGRITTYLYDDAGRQTVERNPAGGETLFTHDDAGRLLTVTAPHGGVTTNTYNDRGLLATIEDPVDGLTTLTYDDAARLVRRLDPAGNETITSYDEAGRVRFVTDAAGDTTERTYDDAGRLATFVDGLGKATTYGYDDADRLVTITDPLGHTTTSTYDDGGRLITETSPEGIPVHFGYDGRGLHTETRNALGHATTWAYDPAGRLERMTDARGAVTLYRYDDANRLTEIEDERGGIVTFGYDDAGQRTSLEDARDKTWTSTYHALGGLETRTDPLGNVLTRTYDNAGLLRTQVDQLDQLLTFDYDDAGRLETLTAPGETITFGYDEIGRRISASGSSGTIASDYDGVGRLTSSTTPEGSVTYAYDDAGRRATMVTAAGTTTYGHDDAGRLTSLTPPASPAIGFTYDDDGRLLTINRPNGVLTMQAYDAAGRIDTITHSRGATVLDRFDYGLDANGNTTSVLSPSGTTSFTIDELNRLERASYPGGRVVDYTYDAAGNRKTTTEAGSTTTYAYDDAGRLTSAGSTTMTYDDAGRRLTAGADSFAWDWAGRMTSATVAGTTSTFDYTVDDGLRASSTTSGTTTPYTWDRASGVAELASVGSTPITSAGGNPIVIGSGAGASYPLVDQLGSVRGLTNTSGAITASAAYDAFGARTGGSGSVGALGFTGGLTGPGGMVYLQARDLDPGIGQFFAPDPVRPGAPGVGGFNQYAYVGNNPTTWVDPTGQMALATTATHHGSMWPVYAALGLLGLILLATLVDTTDILEDLWNRPTVEDDERNPPRPGSGNKPDPKPDPEPEGPRPPLPPLPPQPPRRCQDQGPGFINYHAPNGDFATGIDARIVESMLRTGTDAAQIPVPGFTDGTIHDRGHLLAKVLGGDGRRIDNLVTMYKHPNEQTMNRLEQQVKDAVEQECQEVTYNVTPIYLGNGTLPVDFVEMVASGDGGFVLFATVENEPHG